MKKLAVIIVATLIPILTWGQAQITTKKVKISDFTQKITKIVLSGNHFQDSILQDGVTLYWRISPYEFCTMEEFNRLKTSDEFYFLLSVNGQFKNDAIPTIQYLTLVKGGPGAADGINEMLEVVSMPVGAAQDPSGREAVFMPAMLDIIQNYTLASMEKDSNAYGGLNSFVDKVDKHTDMLVVISENDLSSSARKMKASDLTSEGLSIASEEETDGYILDGKEGVAVSYVVSPSDPLPGAVCYRMIIDAYSHQLYYYSKGKVSKKDGAGFTPNEIKKIQSIISNQ